MQYRSKTKEAVGNEIKCKKDPRPIYVVMEAIMNLLTTDAYAPNMDQTIAKLFDERIIRFSGKWYEEDGKRWFYRPDTKTRIAAQALIKMGLVKYVVPTEDGYPDWENIGWALTSFREFHETFSELLYRKIRENNEKGQRNRIYEKAYEVFEKIRVERGWPEKFYPAKEIPWYAKD